MGGGDPLNLYGYSEEGWDENSEENSKTFNISKFVVKKEIVFNIF